MAARPPFGLLRRVLALSTIAVLLFSALACDRQNPPGAATPFYSADSLREAGRLADALELYRSLRDSLAGTGDSVNLWRAQLWWSDTFRRLGQTDSARPGLAQALHLAGSDRNRVGWTRLMISFVLERDGQLDSSFTEAIAALELARATSDRKLEAYAHDALGTAHSLRGRYREALASDSTSLGIRRELGLSPANIAQSLNEMGIGYRHLGRYTDAVRVYEEALEIHRGLKNELGLAMVSYNLANIRSATGETEQAATLLHQSLEHSERLQDRRGIGFNHNGLAALYLRAGNYAAARAHVESGLRVNRAQGLKYGEILALENLGRLELGEGRPAEAKAALRAALSLADSAGFGRERVGVRAALVSAAITQGGAVPQALRWAKEAILIADSLGDPAAQFQALEAQGRALEAARRGAALDSYLRGIDLLESWRGRLALGDLRMGVSEPRLSVYEGAIRLLFQRERYAQAFEVAERARARLLLELMAERDGRSAQSREQELKARLRESYEARWEVRYKEARNRLDREIQTITAELSAMSEREPQTSDRGSRQIRPIPAAELQQGLLKGSDNAVLAYFWGDSMVYGWWLTGDSVRAARLGTSDSLAGLVTFLRTAVERPNHQSLWRGAAEAAFRRLVEPLAPGKVDQVFVVNDGPLAHVPLEVLVPVSGGTPWGATARFIYGPSATVLLSLYQTPATAAWPRTLLAVGNPSSGTGVTEPAAERDEGTTLVPLPYAADEARAVHRLFRDRGADLLLGKQATPSRWLALRPSRYRYLHFAAHARVSDRRPEETHLVLSGGTLDLSSIRRLRLQSELVTLSACETALGRRVRGEGVIGLSHAFLAAGARGTLVTLWRIGDKSAADFMREFYQELHAARSPAAALLAVRRRWIGSGGAAAHPSHWAPFVLVGGLDQ